MNTNDSELQFLRDIRTELINALGSIEGRCGKGIAEHFIFHSTTHVWKAVDGYIVLRENDRLDASKHLIRPVIEAFFKINAVRRNPEAIYRIAFSEFEEDRKWVRPLNQPNTPDALHAIDLQWQEFRRQYETQYPGHPLIENSLSVYEAARLAGHPGYYDAHYRLYCRFTHAAFAASTGYLNDLEHHDNKTMYGCALAVLDALTSIGAEAPNLPSLLERLVTLSPDLSPP